MPHAAQTDASASTGDSACVAEFDKCGGSNMTMAMSCCDPTATCVIKNRYFAACVVPDKVNDTWDGRALAPSEQVPDDLFPVKQVQELDPSCPDDTCVMKWDQCGGGDLATSAQCCEEGTSCVVKVRCAGAVSAASLIL